MQRMQGIRVTVGRDYGAAVPQQETDDRRSDSSRRAGDHHDFARLFHR